MPTPTNSLKRLPTRDSSRMLHRASIAGLALAMILCLQTPLQAGVLRCDGADAQRLKEAEASYFNLFHFSVFDDIDNCQSLQMALEYQLRLTGWVQRCDPDRLPQAQARLHRLSDLGDDATHCRG